MEKQKAEEIKDTAIKLNEIKEQNPNDYFYLKGWIHCILQKETELSDKSPKQPA